MKHQNKKDKMDEAYAGRAYNKSKKHREAESRGMKKALKKKPRHADEKEDMALIRKMVKKSDLKRGR